MVGFRPRDLIDILLGIQYQLGIACIVAENLQEDETVSVPDKKLLEALADRAAQAAHILEAVEGESSSVTCCGGT